MRLGIEAGSHTIDIALEQGIKGIPISADQLVRDGVSATLEPLHSRGFVVCQIGAFGFNPLSTDSNSQEQQRKLLSQAIPLAAETGCPYIVINGGNYHPSGFLAADSRNFTPSALEQVAQELAPFVSLAEKYAVNLSIEPYLKTAISSPESFLALKKLLPSHSLRVNVDVTSLFAYHELWNPDPAVEHICHSLAGHYGLVHIKDIVLKEGFHIHIELGPLGSTPTDWSQLLRLVDPFLPQDSWVILEHVTSIEEAHNSLNILRQAASKAGVLLA